MQDSVVPATRPAVGILRGQYLWVTVGTCALVFLAAFESLAVTTIMPLVSRELDGAGLYALAFAGPLATGVIGMVAAGNWSDRRGPTAPLYVSVALFVAGLLIAGTSASMPVLVTGRLVQGLGGGALTVALYVLVARIYPAALHPKIFAAFSAAWVIPSLVGPFAAGIVAQVFSWHWVFLGVVGLVIPALVVIAPVLKGLEPPREPAGGHPLPPWAPGRLAWATLAALAVLALNLSRELRIPGVPAAPALVAVAAVVLALLAVRPLVPRGTLTARRGLPSVILVRGLAAAAFFGAEVYLPYLLIEQYAFSPTFAGLTLTGGALAWAGASAVQGRLGSRLSHRRAVGIGAVMVLGAVILALATTALRWPAAVVIAGWIFAGGGMGLLYPRLSVMTLALSSKENEGFNSSAMSIADSLGGALALATTGIVFAAFTTTAESFAGVFALAAVVAAAAVIIAPRVRGASLPAPPRRR
ncbi:MFS transporter [Pseudarthrobacter phenanthrenivorans]|uniref:MFS transporter n=1 Tax=Pseudarthrobacter phenanthrenivorans TaxID=361575 RepID=A0A3B0FIV0_PSEPS|nr:MFS transporter [Pseudarthrobacter phenanthrenivorans]RKO19785.1 MFS transporter [Pseudarthrobacter phenanthrenivorans]TPV50599.1 MFS transporter [Pseudarthrobacter phenanthrenivorans]